MYIHIPKDKRTKLDPSGRKGIFVGYSDTSNSYQIYFPGFRNIDISRYVAFDEYLEYLEYFRSRRKPIHEVDEREETREGFMEIEEIILENHENHDMPDPQEPI